MSPGRVGTVFFNLYFDLNRCDKKETLRCDVAQWTEALSRILQQIVGSIPESSGTLDFEGWQMKLCWIYKISYYTLDRKFGLVPNFYTHLYVSDLYIFTIDPPILLYSFVFADHLKSVIDTWIYKVGTRPRSFIFGNICSQIFCTMHL